MQRALLFLLATVSFVSAQQPDIFAGGVGNAASAVGQPAISPGSWVSIFGTELAAGLAEADTVPISTSLSGIRVLFDEIPAPLLFVSQGQINAQVPWSVLDPVAAVRAAENGMVSVVVERNGVRSVPEDVPVIPSSPGLWTFPSGGIGRAIVINLDGTLAQPVGSIEGLVTHPAPIGSTVLVWGTGLGEVTPPIPAGAAPVNVQPLEVRFTVAQPKVLIDGVEQNTTFSGLANEFPAVNQMNVIIVQGTPVGGDLPITVQVDDIVSPPGATVAISAAI